MFTDLRWTMVPRHLPSIGLLCLKSSMAMVLDIQTEFVLDPRINLRTFSASVQIAIASQSARLQFASSSNVASLV